MDTLVLSYPLDTICTCYGLSPYNILIIYLKIVMGITIAAGPLIESLISDGAEVFFVKSLRGVWH